jgi:tetratricopeptide (TPR) repeat protein
MTRHASPLLAACLVLALGACASPEERAAEYLARAQELFAAGDLENAQLEARNAVQILPKNVEARWILAQIAEREKEYGQMVANLAVVVEEDPKNAAAKVKMGTLLVYSQDYAGAGMLADDALAMNPDDPEAHVLKARVLLQKQDVDGTLAELDRAIELAPGNLDAAALRAVALSLRDAGQAVADLEASIARVGPQASEPLRQLRVDLLARLGRNDEVEQELKSLVAEFGTDKYTTNLALYYTSKGRLDEAEQVLREAVASRPEDVAAKVALAQFQSKYRQKPDEAERSLKGFVAGDPKNQQLLTYLANFYEGVGRAPEALATYRDVAELGPKTPQGLAARNRIVALELRGGNVAAAREALEGILEDEPDNVEALLTRGEIHAAEGRHDEAIADLRSVLRREPDNQLGLLIMAQTHQAVGDRPLAEDAYRRLLQVNPRQVEALTALGSLLAESGQVQEAKQLIDDALAAAPDDRRVLEAAIGIALATRDTATAEERARRLAAGDDPDGVGQRELGRVLEAQGKLPAATEAYRKALARKPDSTLAMEGVVRTLQARGQLAEATRFLREHLEAHPDHVLARVLLGGNYLRAGQMAQAREALNAAIDQQPQLARAYMVLSATYPDDPAGRIAALERGLEANPEAGNLAVLLASEFQRSGRVEDAIRLYEGVLERNDAMPQVANNLAALLLDHRDDAASHKRALDIAQRFSSSRQPMFLDTLGWAHYRNKDYDSAIRFLELAVAYGRIEPEARYHLAMAYLATDNAVGAKQELEKALKDSAGRAPWAAEAQKTLDSLAAAPPNPTPQG